MTNRTTYHCEVKLDGTIVCTPATGELIARRSAAACSRSWLPRRFDPISQHNNGAGWSWDSSAIKECSEGDYVKFEDFEEAGRLADDAMATLREIKAKYGLGDRHVMREKNHEIEKLRVALKDAAELLGEIMRDEVNHQDEAEKWLRAYAPQYLNKANGPDAGINI